MLQESLYGKFQMVVCVTYCMAGLALLAMCMSLIQEGLMIKVEIKNTLFTTSASLHHLHKMFKAERMKNKMSGGKTLVTIDNIKIRFSDIGDKIAHNHHHHYHCS